MSRYRWGRLEYDTLADVRAAIHEELTTALALLTVDDPVGCPPREVVEGPGNAVWEVEVFVSLDKKPDKKPPPQAA